LDAISESLKSLSERLDRLIESDKAVHDMVQTGTDAAVTDAEETLKDNQMTDFWKAVIANMVAAVILMFVIKRLRK